MTFILMIKIFTNTDVALINENHGGNFNDSEGLTTRSVLMEFPQCVFNQSINQSTKSIDRLID
jgi:hypothetical protein